MNFLLKLRAWQLFLLIFGVPYILGFVVTGLNNFVSNGWIFTLVLGIQFIFFIGGLISWFWAIGIALNKKVNPKIRMKATMFKYSLLYTVVWWSVYLIYWVPKLQIIGEQLRQNDDMFTPAIMSQFNSGSYVLVMLFQSIAMICMFYAVYFLAKNLVMAERQENIASNDFTGSFFALLLFPVGIWLIQPRVIKLCSEPGGK